MSSLLISTILRGGARESRNNVPGLLIGLNNGVMGRGSSNRSFLWDFEFGDLLLTSIAGRVWRHGGNSALCIDMMLMRFA